MERHLSVILAADVVGYSRLMEQDEAGTFERLRAYRKDLFEPEIEMRHGRIFKLMGDGLLAEFPSAIDAVECAATLQRSMAERNSAVHEDRRVDIRIGINLGEVIVENEDRYGEGVNIAARIQELTEPGGICVSGKVAAEVRKKLAVGLEPMGERSVKNIAEPITLFRVRLDEVPTRRSSIGRRGGGKEWFRVAAFVGTVLLLTAAGATLSAVNWWRVDKLSPFDKPSIAVLPFDNRSNDPKWQSLADAVTEDITANLSQSRDLFVIARNSSDVYRDKAIDAREVGRDLGVRYVMEGSVSVVADKLRITAQLIEASSGIHIWSQRYEGGIEDVAAAQDDVTRKIAGTLAGYEGVVAEADRAKALRKPPASLQAYELYLLGMAAKHKETKEDNIKAIELFRKAIEIDPNFARAYVGLSWAYSYEMALGYTESFSRSIDHELAAAQKALALDPYDAEAHLAVGVAYNWKGDFERAWPEYDLALSMAPNNADLLLIYAGSYASRDKAELGPELAQRALRLNPNYPAWYNRLLTSIYYFGGKFENASTAARQTQNPGLQEYVLLAASYGQLNRAAEAAEAAAIVRDLDPEFSAEAQLWMPPGQKEWKLFIDGVRKAGLPVCAEPAYLKANTNVTPLDECAVARSAS